MIDPYAKRVKSPTGNLLIYLNKYDESKLDNKKLEFLLKNILTHFRKLFYSTSLLHNLQKDKNFIDNNNKNNIFSIQNIEYFYYKITTIWDVAYEIADILIFPRNKGKGVNKYDYLSKKFEQYNDDLSNLDFSWYREISKIRNRIVHGGINIVPYYINDDNVEKRICFQAYDIDLNDLIVTSNYYSNIYNNNINYADNYFTLHIHLLYSYLLDFFSFILKEMTNEKQITEVDLSPPDDIPEEFYNIIRHDTWLLSDVDVFKKITDEMILLKYSEGFTSRFSNFKPHETEIIIKSHYTNFPFSMMNNITEGDWVVEDKTD